MNYRRKNSYVIRETAAQLAHDRPHERHIANGDEQKFRHDAHTIKDDCDEKHNKANEGDASYLMSFTKGLPHNKHTGLINNPQDFQDLVQGIDSGNIRDFQDTALAHSSNNTNQGCKMPDVDKDWHSKKGKETNKIRAWESQSAGLAYDCLLYTSPSPRDS